MRGHLPLVHTDLPALLDFTRTNLDTFWRGIASQIEVAGVDVVGKHDLSIVFVGLGPARLHHLLTRRILTSKSGAGLYLHGLDPRWAKLAQESLCLREHPDTPTLYDNPTDRGQDVYAQLTWIIQDGTGR